MLTKQKINVHIRWMIRRDMPEVLHIEKSCFTECWTEEDFLKVLKQRNCIGMVAELGEKIIGFMIYELHKNRLEVLSFAVDPEYQRRGVGQQMANKLVSKLSSHRRTAVSLEVKDANLDAQLFFASQGFKAVKVLRNHYENGDDAYRFRYSIDTSEFVEEEEVA